MTIQKVLAIVFVVCQFYINIDLLDKTERLQTDVKKLVKAQNTQLR
jgi:hypothetical protein